MEEERQIEIQHDDTFVDDGEIVVNLSGRHLDCWNEIQAEDTFEDNIDGDNNAAADLVVLIQMMMVSRNFYFYDHYYFFFFSLPVVDNIGVDNSQKWILHVFSSNVWNKL